MYKHQYPRDQVPQTWSTCQLTSWPSQQLGSPDPPYCCWPQPPHHISSTLFGFVFGSVLWVEPQQQHPVLCPIIVPWNKGKSKSWSKRKGGKGNGAHLNMIAEEIAYFDKGETTKWGCKGQSIYPSSYIAWLSAFSVDEYWVIRYSVMT
jgi:hypothetical protein